MFDLNEIYALYDAYVEKIEELNRNKKVTDGLLGITKGPKDDPCHDRFIKDLEEKIHAFTVSDPDPEQVYDLLKYMYTVPLKFRDGSNNMVYWMFTAVHTLVIGLIGRLPKEKAATLYRLYYEDYPRRERLPAQKKTLKALKAQM